MQTKRYLENLIQLCSDHRFGQEAVEWAVLSGHVQLTYHQEQDLQRIMGPAFDAYEIHPMNGHGDDAEPLFHPDLNDVACWAVFGHSTKGGLHFLCNQPTAAEAENTKRHLEQQPITFYDWICDAYRAEVHENTAALIDSYGPLLAELRVQTPALAA